MPTTMSTKAPPDPASEKPPEDKGERFLTIVEHIQELRFRMTVCALAVVAGMVVSGIFTGDFIEFLKQPALDRSDRVIFIYTEPLGGFVPYFQVILLGGFILAMPIIVYQVLGFVTPGLKPNEKRWLYGTAIGATALFLVGVAFAYYIALPPGLDFLLSLDIAEPQLRIGSYIDFVVRLLFFTGLSFQTPLIIMFLARIGLVRSGQLLHWWRPAVVGAFVVAAIVTPSVDPVTCTIVAVPMVGLYFLGILLAVFVQPRRKANAD